MITYPKYIKFWMRGQFMAKSLCETDIVETNRFIEVKKQVKDLKVGDSVLIKGAWYDIEQIGDSPYTAEEQKVVNNLISSAAAASDTFGDDVLEQHKKLNNL